MPSAATMACVTLAPGMYPHAHPWLRVQLAIRIMLRTRWGDQWPAVKSELRKARQLRQTLHRAPWWN